MKNIHGCITALITPFNEKGNLDKIALKKLIKRQILNQKKTKTHIFIKNTKYPNKDPTTNESLFRKTKLNDCKISK